MSFRVTDTLLFVVMVGMVLFHLRGIGSWTAYAVGWAFGRWLVALMEEWEEEGER